MNASWVSEKTAGGETKMSGILQNVKTQTKLHRNNDLLSTSFARGWFGNSRKTSIVCLPRTTLPRNVFLEAKLPVIVLCSFTLKWLPLSHSHSSAIHKTLVALFIQTVKFFNSILGRHKQLVLQERGEIPGNRDKIVLCIVSLPFLNSKYKFVHTVVVLKRWTVLQSILPWVNPAYNCYFMRGKLSTSWKL